jgi:hypothetical protein
MQPGIVPGTFMILPVTLCILTISYRGELRFPCSCPTLFPQRFGLGKLGLLRHSSNSKPFSPFLSLNWKISLNAECKSVPLQTQQRWADRPTQIESLLDSASYPHIIHPAISSHCSARRYCAWTLCIFQSSTTAQSLLPKIMEPLDHLSAEPEVEIVNHLRLQPLGSFDAHHANHRRKQNSHSTSSRVFISGRNACAGHRGARLDPGRVAIRFLPISRLMSAHR